MIEGLILMQLMAIAALFAGFLTSGARSIIFFVLAVVFYVVSIPLSVMVKIPVGSELVPAPEYGVFGLLSIGMAIVAAIFAFFRASDVLGESV